MKAKVSAWNLFWLASYSKFGFSRPDLDGNKPAIFEFKSSLKGLREDLNLHFMLVITFLEGGQPGSLIAH